MRAIATLAWIVFAAAAQAQEKKVKTLEVSDTIVFAAIDRPGDLYVVTRLGHMQRFDKNGVLMQLFRPPEAPTLFDPRDGARLFAFFRQQRQYTFFNPSFEPRESYRIDSAYALEPWLACASGDHNVWILDGADLSLKKVDTKRGEVVVDVPVHRAATSSKQVFTFLREYQGFLFLLDRSSGIRVYNSVGQYIRTLGTPATASFNFLGGEIYYPTSQGLEFFDLFTADKRLMTLSTTGKFVLASDERMYIVNGRTVSVYAFAP